MPSRKSNKSKRSRKQAGKVGSDPIAARKFGGRGDFGVPETGHERERQYVSRETKLNDPGAMPEHSGNEGTRTTGVGGNASGDGSSSGGDLDTDIVGVGTGGSGVSASGPDQRTEGPDMIGGDKPTSPHESNPTRPHMDEASGADNSRSDNRR